MKLRYVICLLFFIMPVSSFAFYIVNDIGMNIKTAQALHQAYKNYAELRRQYEKMKQQLLVSKQIAADEEGHYGYGHLLNGPGDLKNREWSPGSWSEALKGLSGGNSARYQELLKQYKNDNPTLSKAVYKKGASDANARVYQQQIKTNQAVAVNTTYAFNNIKRQLENIHQLSSQIEATKNAKAATDLNTRMQTETAYVQVQMLKQITLLNEQMARTRADRVAAETAAARFNTLPKQ